MTVHLRAELSVADICASVGVTEDLVREVVAHGIVEPRGDAPEEWYFDAHMAIVAKKAFRLQRELEIDWAGVAVALELMDKLEQLSSENNMLRQRLWAGVVHPSFPYRLVHMVLAAYLAPALVVGGVGGLPLLRNRADASARLRLVRSRFTPHALCQSFAIRFEFLGGIHAAQHMVPDFARGHHLAVHLGYKLPGQMTVSANRLYAGVVFLMRSTERLLIGKGLHLVTGYAEFLGTGCVNGVIKSDGGHHADAKTG